MILNFAELSKNLFSTNKILRRFLVTTIETSQSVVLALQYYLPISLCFKNKELILTPELLLDYGLVHQIICSDLSQASKFEKKMALDLAQGFKMNKTFADAIIISKTPEWVSNGSIVSLLFW